MTQQKRATILVARRLDKPKSGNAVYLRAFLRLLRDQGVAVTLVLAPSRSFGNQAWARIHPDILALCDAIRWDKAVRLGDWFVSTSPRVWRRAVWRIGFWAVQRLRGTPLAKPASLLGERLDAADDRAVARALRQTEADLVVAEYSATAPALRHATAVSKAVLLHDLFSLRAAAFRAAGQKPDHIDITLAEEAARCRHADTLIHASRSEQAALEAEMPAARHIWMQPSVTVPKTLTPRAGGPRAVFFGVRHAGNVATLSFLLDEIWPRVRAALPDAQLWVAGSVGDGLSADQTRLGGVQVQGVVKDLTEIGGPQSIGLAPTTLESGVSIKVLDYIALRMPVVVLPPALNGYGAALDDMVLRADDPQSFADAVVRLLQDADLREALAKRAFDTLPDVTANRALIGYLESIWPPT